MSVGPTGTVKGVIIALDSIYHIIKGEEEVKAGDNHLHVSIGVVGRPVLA